MLPKDVAMLGWTLLVPKVAIATEKMICVGGDGEGCGNVG